MNDEVRTRGFFALARERDDLVVAARNYRRAIRAAQGDVTEALVADGCQARLTAC
jgi:hypothetical protein